VNWSVPCGLSPETPSLNLKKASAGNSSTPTAAATERDADQVADRAGGVGLHEVLEGADALADDRFQDALSIVSQKIRSSMSVPQASSEAT